MKELSIEKTAAYDEAIYNNYKSFNELIERLESVKNAIKEHNYGIAMDILCNPYPEYQITKSTELEESDERTKNEIIAFVEQSIHRGGGTPIPQEQENKWLAWLEKQGEQKSTGKPEPKFHEGEWIVNVEYGNVVRVLKVLEDNYRLDFGGDTIGTLCTELVDSDYRLWNIIQDAKDGDVFVHNGLTFIFKGIEDGIVKGLCLGISDSILNFGEPEYDKDYHPATKEQRNALIKVMADAGYIFDFEKKELKKIEQKSWSEDDEKLAQAKKDAYNDALDKIEYHNIEPTFDDGWDAAIWYLKKRNIQPQSKQKWSEEDEKMRTSCVACIGYHYHDGLMTRKEYEHTRDWLTSLKGRVQPKPSWSEEDENTIKDIIEDLEYAERKGYVLKNNTFLKEIHWLKTLKGRYTWKPSKEQMKALYDLNLTCNISYAGQCQTLIELYNDLKKLDQLA